MKLASDLNKDKKIKEIFKWTIWGLNALTTGLFGFVYLPKLYSIFLAMTPISEAYQAWIAGTAAAITAVFVLDGSYLAWGYLKMYLSESDGQYWTATTAQYVSFALSVLYTIMSVSTIVAPQLMGSELVAIVEAFGIVSFIAVLCGHLIAHLVFSEQSPDTSEKRARVKMAAKRKTEQLSFQEQVHNEALGLMAKKVQNYRSQLSKGWGDDWTRQLLDETTNRPALPASKKPTIIEGESTPAEGNEAKVFDGRAVEGADKPEQNARSDNAPRQEVKPAERPNGVSKDSPFLGG